MQNSAATLALATAILAAPLVSGAKPASAQEPLSVIEWLGDHPPATGSGILLEPPVSRTGLQPEVDVIPLPSATQAIGLVPADVTGLPTELWEGSDTDTLARLIRDAPVQDSPAMQKLLFTLLLTEATPPRADGSGSRFLLSRIDRLMDLGAIDPAQALAETASPAASADLFRRWFDATLLTGSEDTACALLSDRAYLAPDYRARIFCSARQGDWQTAALTLESAHALDLLPADQLDLMDRFLSPDVFEGAPPLPAPANPDPLTFRLHETIGESLPTASLPRAFATADLRDLAGWKAQLEAAERLTRIGALVPNRLLGLYTDRDPSASGGIWDRVAAVQRFDTALGTGSADAVAKTLPTVWATMRDAHLEVPFASLFAERLRAVHLTDPAARLLASRIQLLSPDYATVALPPATDDAMQVFLSALAQGDPTAVPAPNATAEAIADGFAAGSAPQVPPQRMGETLLRAIVDFDNGANGNSDDLGQALATLRAAGLEDTARRAALQLMLLGERRA